jgi:hypothetical protein
MLFCKKSVSEKILELFSYEKRLGLKMNYLKRQGQDSGATGLAQSEMGRGARLEQEGQMRRGKKSRLAAGRSFKGGFY